MAGYRKVKTSFNVAAFVFVVSMVMMSMISGCSTNQNFDISGTVTSGGLPLAGVTLTLTGKASMTATTDGTGRYVLPGLEDGQYTLTPTFPGYAFIPSTWSFTVNGMGTSRLNFVGTSLGMVATTLHTVYMTSLTSAYTWGNNSKGQIGDGTTGGNELSPVQVLMADLVTPLLTVKAIAAGDEHTVALKSDGTVWAWGGNSKGQLGDGTIIDEDSPVQVMLDPLAPTPLTGVTAISAGDAHTVALKSDGTVWTWGSNSNGQLGDGTTIDEDTPVQVMLLPLTPLTGMIAVSAGHQYTVALKSDGTVWAWGSNSSGQLGDGTPGDEDTPVQVMMADLVTPLTGVTAISAGHDNSRTPPPAPDTGTGTPHTVALKNDGTVWAWGKNSSGELGDGTTANQWSPVQSLASAGVPLTAVTVIAAGDDHTAVLKNDGTVWAWGNNSKGQLGNNSTVQSNFPVQASGLSNIMYIAAGFKNTIARRKDGTIWAWGNNSNGQLGNGNTTPSSIPVQALYP